MMTIKYGLQICFFELTDNDGQNFLAGIVPQNVTQTLSTLISLAMAHTHNRPSV
jgi:hypothetical protein